MKSDYVFFGICLFLIIKYLPKIIAWFLNKLYYRVDDDKLREVSSKNYGDDGVGLPSKEIDKLI